MKTKPEIEIPESTEEKIKEAARRVFTRKGFAGTRTRDIAEESGFNLALINYYFRSKEKLFDIIVLEHMQTFLVSVREILNDQGTTLEEKILALVSHYIDMLIRNPDIPMFVLSVINADPLRVISKSGMIAVNSDLYVVKQWNEFAAENKSKINPRHLIMNVLSMTIFPFVAGPLLRSRTGMTQEDFNALMLERKKLIPMWVKAMIND
jgi:AcrR family transcriptional regulator